MFTKFSLLIRFILCFANSLSLCFPLKLSEAAFCRDSFSPLVMVMLANLARSCFRAMLRSLGGQTATLGKGNPDTRCGVMVVAIGELDQLVKEDWMSQPAHPKPRATIKVHPTCPALDREVAMYDRPWIVEDSRNSLKRSMTKHRATPPLKN